MKPVTPLGRHSARAKQLRRRARHRVAGEVVVEGRRIVSDLVRWKLRLRELYLTEELSTTQDAARWVAAAQQAWEVSDAFLDLVSTGKTHQGVLAVLDEPSWPPWQPSVGITLFLDGVQSPGNLGAVIRSAAALDAAAVLLAPGCCDPYTPAAVRGAAGAVFRICVERNVDADDSLTRVRAAGGEVWATSASAKTVVATGAPRRPLLLLLGAEGAGLRSSLQDEADRVVAIPLSNQIESLNVAVVAGILLAQLRQASG